MELVTADDEPRLALPEGGVFSMGGAAGTCVSNPSLSLSFSHTHTLKCSQRNSLLGSKSQVQASAQHVHVATIGTHKQHMERRSLESKEGGGFHAHSEGGEAVARYIETARGPGMTSTIFPEKRKP
ncbi:hypothetical protein MN608_00333 [Microdochium nivale]|nr:hypothetical protein MN608_00333 [Microdochium nivale]